MTILEALAARTIFGAAFGDAATWRAWAVFLAACFGLDLTQEQLAIYQRHTGRQTPPRAPAREVWCIAGRRAGKSRIAALLALFVALFLHDFATLLAPGERAVIAVIAADRQQARVVFRYVVALLEAVPMLRRLVVRQTQSTVELANGAVIEITTCSHRSTRGYTFACVIADEAAFWRSETSAEPDVEVLNAVRPGLATIPGSMLVAISSPYSRRGALWTAYRHHYGKDGDPVLVWQADTASMNPTVDPTIIAAAYQADEAAASAEYGALFRSDLEAFVAREVIDACTVPGRHELPPIADVAYVGFADPSGGSADSFTLAIAHAEGERLVLDVLRERKPPFNPSEVVAEYTALLKSYRLSRVSGDRYAGDWPREQFRHHGVEYAPAERPKSDLYAALLPALNSHRVELLDLPHLHTQLVSLERRTARGGRDSIDHPSGGHDGAANAVAGAIVGVLGDGGKFWGYGEHLAYLAQRAAPPAPVAEAASPALGPHNARPAPLAPGIPHTPEEKRAAYAKIEEAFTRGWRGW